MKTLQVELGERSYPIHIGAGLYRRAELLGPYVAGRRVAIITNETVAPLYLGPFQAGLGLEGALTVALPDGEAHKNLEVLAGLFDRLLAAGCDRRTVLIALGGGVVGDLTGFAAACYQRGIDYVQAPTTLLAQVDSSVGGKTGVNHPRGKNMIGAFHQPRAVLIDTDTLATLPERELRAGTAEIIKYGLIRDPELFDWLEQHLPRLLAREADALVHAVERSCRNKAEVVRQDEREGGVRATLNLGHTFGHALETGLGYGRWLHGEAVAAGMAVAAQVSHRLGWLARQDLARIEAVIAAAGLPAHVPGQLDAQQLWELMTVDKKTEGGRLRLVLLQGIGRALVTSDFPPALVQQVLAERAGRSEP